MKNKNVVFRTFALISQLGISMIVPVILCTVAGVYLDDKFSISVTIPLIIVGILAGARNAYVLVRQARDAIASEKDEEE